jgi:uroporphyrin-III C-methyltransferase
MTGRVFLIGAGPGDPGLLTLKAKDCLEQSDVVVYDRLVSPEILAFIPSHAERIYVGKEANNHTLPQEKIEALLVEKALRGYTVSRLKGGDPFVFGRGAEEAEALAAKGIPFEIVPGVSSAIAAPAYAGIPLTHRRLASGFHVVTGHECLHSTGTPWQVLALSSQTLVILMGMKHLQEIADKLISYGRASDTPVAVVRWGTTSHQKVVVGTLATIAAVVEENQLKPPAVIVVGNVVRLRDILQWFEPAKEFSL